MINLEVKVGVPVEYVLCSEVSNPVWIQIIVNHFGLSAKSPHGRGQIGLAGLQSTHRIWQGKQIHVIQVTTLNK